MLWKLNKLIFETFEKYDFLPQINKEENNFNIFYRDHFCA